ncbi:ABC transporter permease subunit [Aquibacillus halophilus]|uniref:ABC transporter permease subunit n=1 Tax=Aquibacillus halophilus TaxID=930132 RepID=A0A6A8DCD1_9BACI|nr:carbohydrate ABC transporter permease [Aquibacillus halophilus]MRH43298.1 ABC transporter permease subunit [Aquibacillus halophilus]
MKKNKTFNMRKLVIRILLLIATVIFVYPILWNVIASFKTNEEVLESPWSLPAVPQFDNFVRAFTEASMGEYILNSFFVTALSMFFLLLLVIPTAHAISRFDFRGRKLLHNFYMAGLFIQPVYIMVPLFLLMNNLHMLDNRLWLSLVYAASALPFSIYLLAGFMKSIPKEYEQAASIDGCGYFLTLVKIIVPLARPGILTVIIFNFFTFWNEYALALVLMTTDEKKTIPIGLANLMEVQRFATDWGALFAGLVLVLIPTITLYALTQKKLTEGMSMGGLKG